MGNNESTTSGYQSKDSEFMTGYRGGRQQRGDGIRKNSTIIGVTHMRPSELRFTHESISNNFTDGHSLQETFKQFLYGEIRIQRNEVPPLVAMYYEGYWFVIRGNRRLFILQKLESVGQMSRVKVLKQIFNQETFDKQFTTQNMGMSVRIRREQNIDQKLNAIIREWQTTQHGEQPVMGSSQPFSHREPVGGQRQNEDWCIII